MMNGIVAATGSLVGGFASFASSWTIQYHQSRRQLVERQIAQRETLYSDFIREASRLYADSLAHGIEEAKGVVALYALVGRIRLVGSAPVLEAAEKLMVRILSHYGEPNMSPEQIRARAINSSRDPLREFGLACRKELGGIQ